MKASSNFISVFPNDQKINLMGISLHQESNYGRTIGSKEVGRS